MGPTGAAVGPASTIPGSGAKKAGKNRPRQRSQSLGSKLPWPMISGYVYSSEGTGSPANDSWAWDGNGWTKLAQSEFKLIFDATEIGPFDPRDANRALVANVCSPVIWISRRLRTGPSTERN